MWTTPKESPEQGIGQAGIEAPADANQEHANETEQGTPDQNFSMAGSLLKSFFLKMEKASRNPQLINDTVVNRLPQLMFLMVPVFASFLKLLYLRSEQFYMHHLVFGLHFHSFMFLVLLVMLLTRFALNRAFGAVWLAALPVYLFAGMKRVYGQSFWVTLSKLAVLLVSYFASVFIALMVVAAVSIFFLYE